MRPKEHPWSVLSILASTSITLPPFGTPAAADTPTVAAGPDVKPVEIVYFFDLFLMETRDRDRAVAGLVDMYRSSVPRGERVSVVVFDGELETLVDRTDDRDDVLDALEELGYIRARGIQHGIFQCRFLDRERYGLVGDITGIDLEPLRRTIRAGALPVLTFLGESPSGQVLNVNADVAARELVWAIKPHKVIFLTPSGGLLDRNGRVISAVSVAPKSSV